MQGSRRITQKGSLQKLRNGVRSSSGRPGRLSHWTMEKSCGILVPKRESSGNSNQNGGAHCSRNTVSRSNGAGRNQNPQAVSPPCTRTGPIPNPIILLTIVDVISGSEAQPCSGLQATARACCGLRKRRGHQPLEVEELVANIRG